MSTKKNKYKVSQANTDGAMWNLHEFNINAVSREIYLHGYRDSEWNENEEPEVDYRMATKFIKNLTFLNNQGKENILVHQQTCGGDYNHGMAIYNAIQASKAPVTILCYAHSRSMSSITLQAAKCRVLMPDCLFMVHEGSCGGEDTCKGMRTFMEEVDKATDRMMDVYSERCEGSEGFDGMSRDQIEKYIRKKMDMKQEWFMDAEEAVRYGFADGVFGTKGFETLAKIRK